MHCSTHVIRHSRTSKNVIIIIHRSVVIAEDKTAQFLRLTLYIHRTQALLLMVCTCVCSRGSVCVSWHRAWNNDYGSSHELRQWRICFLQHRPLRQVRSSLRLSQLPLLGNCCQMSQTELLIALLSCFVLRQRTDFTDSFPRLRLVLVIFIIFNSWLSLHESCVLCLVYRVAQKKWGQLTFLMVTFECIGKIQQFLVNVITVIQAHSLGSIKV